MHDTQRATPEKKRGSLVFLNGNRGLRVLRDGPALRIRAPQTADRLYPLTRIDTIWVTGPVEWQAAAWQACIRSAISVYFFDGRGHFIGELRPAPGQDAGPAPLLERWLMTVEGRQQWHDWYNASLLNSQRLSARNSGVDTTPWQWARRLDARLGRLVRATDLVHFRTWLRSALETLAEEQAQAAGLGFDRPFWEIIGIHPIQDLAALLYWRIIPGCLDEIRRMRRHQKMTPSEKLHLEGKTALDIVGRNHEKLSQYLSGYISTLLSMANEGVLSSAHDMHWSEVIDPTLGEPN